MPILADDAAQYTEAKAAVEQIQAYQDYRKAKKEFETYFLSYAIQNPEQKNTFILSLKSMAPRASKKAEEYSLKEKLAKTEIQSEHLQEETVEAAKKLQAAFDKVLKTSEYQRYQRAKQLFKQDVMKASDQELNKNNNNKAMYWKNKKARQQ